MYVLLSFSCFSFLFLSTSPRPPKSAAWKIACAQPSIFAGGRMLCWLFQHPPMRAAKLAPATPSLAFCCVFWFLLVSSHAAIFSYCNLLVPSSSNPKSFFQLASEDCPNGCLSCPGGDEALGLACDLISAESSGDGTIECKLGDDW